MSHGKMKAVRLALYTEDKINSVTAPFRIKERHIQFIAHPTRWSGPQHFHDSWWSLSVYLDFGTDLANKWNKELTT